MSRIGKKPVSVPANVKLTIQGRRINVEGPKGKLSLEHHPNVKVNYTAQGAGGSVLVERVDDEKISRSLHGLTRALIFNMVKGVTDGYSVGLEIEGVGYKAELAGKTVVLSVGLANQLKLSVPEGVAVKIEGQGTRISLSGADKQMVGHFAAEIRRTRKPEPYKGKGIRYVGEVIKRKAGKQFAGAGAK
ncbi:Ribosomal protein L6, subgroup [mine drainage metagenome]|uniref:Ribosomal protein L6, subgroup n=1 Tax=mine drainage metagenome TaxID=410659 RepID=T0Z2I0_9ZZZZ